MNLRVPGPTPLPKEVLDALSKQMINHRGKEFADLIAGVTKRLKELFLTKNDLFVLTGSGTGAMEAAVVNTLSPGDKVLVVSIGYFGDRFNDIAVAFGANVTKLDFPWGTPADPDAVRKALEKDPQIKAVLVTHNETSTGVTNDLKTITQIVRGFDKLLLVDAISSIGSIELPVDEWGCDMVFTASQKGWMVPPGLAFMSVNEKAWQAHKVAKMPRNYWDISKAKSYLERGQTPWTPAVSVFFALDVALDMMLKEGLSNIIARHQRVGRAARQGVQSLGLSPIAREPHASNTVTCVVTPQGLDVAQLLKTLREKHKVVLAGGQGPLTGKTFRIGHLGYVTENDIKGVINALDASLKEMGFQVPVPSVAKSA